MNGSKDFLDFLHNDSSGKLMNSRRARFSIKKCWGRDMGDFRGQKRPFLILLEFESKDFAENLSKDSSTQDLSNHVGQPYI